MKIITTVGASVFGNCQKADNALIKEQYDYLELKDYAQW